MTASIPKTMKVSLDIPAGELDQQSGRGYQAKRTDNALNSPVQCIRFPGPTKCEQQKARRRASNHSVSHEEPEPRNRRGMEPEQD